MSVKTKVTVICYVCIMKSICVFANVKEEEAMSSKSSVLNSFHPRNLNLAKS